MDLVFEIHKTNVGTRISNLDITVYQFSGKTNNFDSFGPNLPKNGFRVRNSENSCWNKN